MFKQNTSYHRKGKHITKLAVHNEHGKELSPAETKDHGSINKAKKESRRLQGNAPGQGLVQVRK